MNFLCLCSVIGQFNPFKPGLKNDYRPSTPIGAFATTGESSLYAKVANAISSLYADRRICDFLDRRIS